MADSRNGFELLPNEIARYIFNLPFTGSKRAQISTVSHLFHEFQTAPLLFHAVGNDLPDQVTNILNRHPHLLLAPITLDEIVKNQDNQLELSVGPKKTPLSFAAERRQLDVLSAMLPFTSQLPLEEIQKNLIPALSHWQDDVFIEDGSGSKIVIPDSYLATIDPLITQLTNEQRPDDTPIGNKLSEAGEDALTEYRQLLCSSGWDMELFLYALVNRYIERIDDNAVQQHAIAQGLTGFQSDGQRNIYWVKVIGFAQSLLTREAAKKWCQGIATLPKETSLQTAVSMQLHGEIPFYPTSNSDSSKLGYHIFCCEKGTPQSTGLNHLNAVRFSTALKYYFRRKTVSFQQLRHDVWITILERINQQVGYQQAIDFFEKHQKEIVENIRLCIKNQGVIDIAPLLDALHNKRARVQWLHCLSPYGLKHMGWNVKHLVHHINKCVENSKYRYQLADASKEIIQSIDDLRSVLACLPIRDRLMLVESKKDLIINCRPFHFHILKDIFEMIPPNQRFDLAKKTIRDGDAVAAIWDMLLPMDEEKWDWAKNVISSRIGLSAFLGIQPPANRYSFALDRSNLIATTADLASVLPLLPIDKQYTFASINRNVLASAQDLVVVLKQLEEENRYSFVIVNKALITSLDDLLIILDLLPPNDRMALINSNQGKIDWSADEEKFPSLLRKMPESKQLNIAERMIPEIKSSYSLAFVLQAFQGDQNIHFFLLSFLERATLSPQITDGLIGIIETYVQEPKTIEAMIKVLEKRQKSQNSSSGFFHQQNKQPMDIARVLDNLMVHREWLKKQADTPSSSNMPDTPTLLRPVYKMHSPLFFDCHPEYFVKYISMLEKQCSESKIRQECDRYMEPLSEANHASISRGLLHIIKSFRDTQPIYEEYNADLQRHQEQQKIEKPIGKSKLKI